MSLVPTGVQRDRAGPGNDGPSNVPSPVWVRFQDTSVFLRILLSLPRLDTYIEEQGYSIDSPPLLDLHKQISVEGVLLCRGVGTTVVMRVNGILCHVN